MLSNWKKQFTDNAPRVFESTTDKEVTNLNNEIKDLERMLGKKEVELNLLKNFSDFYQSKKYDIVAYARDKVKAKGIGVNEVCKLFGISKDSFYHCCDKTEKFKDKHKKIKKYIEKILEENSFYGVKRIQA